MQLVIKTQVENQFSKKGFTTFKRINPELCVNTESIARQSILGKDEKNDCVVRAFSAVLGITYDKSHAWVEQNFNRIKRNGTLTSTFVGGIIGKVKNGKKIEFYGVSPGHQRKFKMIDTSIITNPQYSKPTGYTLVSFMENHPTGRYFVIVERHAIAIVDGKLYGNRNEGKCKINRRVHYALKVS